MRTAHGQAQFRRIERIKRRGFPYGAVSAPRAMPGAASAPSRAHYSRSHAHAKTPRHTVLGSSPGDDKEENPDEGGQHRQEVCDDRKRGDATPSPLRPRLPIFKKIVTHPDAHKLVVVKMAGPDDPPRKRA